MSPDQVTRRLFEQASRHAADYRRTVGDAAPPLSYSAMLAAFDAPTPEHGTPGSAVIDDLVARSTPGLRAMTARASSAG